jgi:hypothetical protein
MYNPWLLKQQFKEAKDIVLCRELVIYYCCNKSNEINWFKNQSSLNVNFLVELGHWNTTLKFLWFATHNVQGRMWYLFEGFTYIILNLENSLISYIWNLLWINFSNKFNGVCWNFDDLSVIIMNKKIKIKKTTITVLVELFIPW